jgi:hypothetical protein
LEKTKLKVSVILVHPHPGGFSKVIAETVTNSPPQNGHEVKDIRKSAPGNGLPAMFRAAHGDAYFRTMENNMREREAPRVKF